MSGWISLHRKIKKSWISDNAEYFKAWVFILLEVNHADIRTIIDGELIECKRGQSLNSISTWADLFGKGWTRQRVRTFFKLLEKDEKINQEGLRKTTKLSVCNYDTYQSSQPRDNPQKNQEKTTNNNDNKKQLNTSDKSEGKMYKFSEWDMSIAKAYHGHMSEIHVNSSLLRKTNLDKWADEVRKLREIDNHPVQLIADVLFFSRNDSFWQRNLISLASIRGKGQNGFPKFENAMNSGVQKGAVEPTKYLKGIYDDKL